MWDSSWTITDEQREILGDGPLKEGYWDCWNEVLLNARFVDSSGFEWQLFQEGDLFAICPELMTNEEKRNFELDHLIEEEEEA